MSDQKKLEELVRFGVENSRKAIRQAGKKSPWLQILVVVTAALTGGTGPGTDKSRFWDAD